MRSAQGRQRLLSSGIPVVETWDLTDNPIDMLIGFSHEKVGEAVAQYLHRRGKRQVATLSANDQRAQRARRRSPILPWRWAWRCRVRPQCRARWCRRPPMSAWTRRPARTAGAPSGHRCAVLQLGHGGAGRADRSAGARHSRARTTGGGGDGRPEFAADLYPSLTTVRIDGARIGALAARFIVERSQEREVRDGIVDIGFSIVERKCLNAS
jgi:LacI family gluconate utilization system Gnt-I transcriptional repressor